MKRLFICSVAILALAANAEDQVPLALELPKPLFVGTPRPIDLTNLEPPIFGKRPDLLVPSGTVLLSVGKTVTASDDPPIIGELELITDGDKSGVDGSFVEFGPGVQWVQVDLGAPSSLAAIAFWHFHSQARVYHDVIVQVSNDSEFKTGVQTLYNNDHDDTAGFGKGADLAYVETYQGRVIEAKGIVARYVRLYSNGSTTDELNHYCEVEIYGQPVR